MWQKVTEESKDKTEEDVGANEGKAAQDDAEEKTSDFEEKLVQGVEYGTPAAVPSDTQ